VPDRWQDRRSDRRRAATSGAARAMRSGAAPVTMIAAAGAIART
jgi:hypothetical protein